jgi:hypothetical protein
MFFPNSIMPKRLKREDADVDDNPSIFNARDYNIHHREIRAIQEMLVGKADSSGTAPGSVQDGGSGTDSVSADLAASGAANSILGLIDQANDIIGRLSNGNLMFQVGGTAVLGSKISLPNATQTEISGPLTTSGDTITVASTAGFTSSGYLTKINTMKVEELCDDGLPPGAGGRCAVGARKYYEYSNYMSATGQHMTNQEIIEYTGKTATTFTGCSRGMFGSTKQAVSSDEKVLILGGRGALVIYPFFWGLNRDRQFREMYVSWDGLLNVNGGILAPGSRQLVNPSEKDLTVLGWSLTLVAQFADVSVAQVFSGGQ